MAVAESEASLSDYVPIAPITPSSFDTDSSPRRQGPAANGGRSVPIPQATAELDRLRQVRRTDISDPKMLRPGVAPVARQLPAWPHLGRQHAGAACLLLHAGVYAMPYTGAVGPPSPDMAGGNAFARHETYGRAVSQDLEHERQMRVEAQERSREMQMNVLIEGSKWKADLDKYKELLQNSSIASSHTQDPRLSSRPVSRQSMELRDEDERLWHQESLRRSREEAKAIYRAASAEHSLPASRPHTPRGPAKHWGAADGGGTRSEHETHRQRERHANERHSKSPGRESREGDLGEQDQMDKAEDARLGTASARTSPRAGVSRAGSSPRLGGHAGGGRGSPLFALDLASIRAQRELDRAHASVIELQPPSRAYTPTPRESERESATPRAGNMGALQQPPSAWAGNIYHQCGDCWECGGR